MGRDPRTGDGAGLLTQIPHALLEALVPAALPGRGQYVLGQLFLPRAPAAREAAEAALSATAREQGFEVLAWREVPTRPEVLGDAARGGAPHIRQVFLTGRDVGEPARVHLLRRRIQAAWKDHPGAYVASLSNRVVVYKGLLRSDQLEAFYPDLAEPAYATGLALVHRRFSTNTAPSWPLAQPFRMLAHNGEINTVEGNRRWAHARVGTWRSPRFTEAEHADLLPALSTGGSDSADLDEMLSLLVAAGHGPADAVRMVMPPILEPDAPEAARVRRRRDADWIEPWGGPAALVFTDGVRSGASLDPGGLRPARVVETVDGMVIVSSEAGATALAPEDVARRSRLGPGGMLVVDPSTGSLIGAEDLARRPVLAPPEPVLVGDVTPEKLPMPLAPLEARQRAFGWTQEDVARVLEPMIATGKAAIGSMGADVPLAVLSDRGALLYDYLKQRFAQVTNPPLDPIREAVATGLYTRLGPEGNALDPNSPRPQRAFLPSPVLDEAAMASVHGLGTRGLPVRRLEATFEARGGCPALRARLEQLARAAQQAVEGGAAVLVLCDRGVDPTAAPVPALLALGAVHQALVAAGLRTRTSLVLDTGEAREVHHLAALIGFGADAVHPRLAFEAARFLLPEDASEATTHLVRALEMGLRKVMAKVGIVEVQAYRGAQLFEAVGLGDELVERYFTGTPASLGGAELEDVAKVATEHHADGFADLDEATLPREGLYRWRRQGEPHAVTPGALRALHKAVRQEDAAHFAEFVELVDQGAAVRGTIRGLLEPVPGDLAPLPLAEVEPVEDIVRRFTTGAMSYGSLGAEVHEALAVAMNRLGGRSNSGEGGEDPARFVVGPDGADRSSAIKQVASGRFGVTTEYLVNARELQIKMAQGAKPGEGGHLPAQKVHPWIAATRRSTPFVGLISPPPHHDIYSIEDLAQLIYDLQCVNPSAEVSVKLTSEVGVGTVAAGVAKAGAERILVSGHEGGTGAAALGSIHHAGAPWELGLAEAQQTLLTAGLRSRIRLQVDGGLRTGRDLVIAALLGADEFSFGTAALLAAGCIMRRVCHEDRCPVGIATQRPDLREKFPGHPDHVVAFMRFVAEDLRRWMARLGFRTVGEMVGRTEHLRPRPEAAARRLDLAPLLVRPEAPVTVSPGRGERPGLATEILEALQPALSAGWPAEYVGEIGNTDRAIGARIAGEVVRAHGPEGLEPDTARVVLRGEAGQSLGAFLPPGVTIELTGVANDHVAKGLSGGRVSVEPPPSQDTDALIGNVALYGATGGELFVAGRAGERFAVRNSGARAVVEGVGDHGCEYMTGGRVVVLGSVGRNFAAGMSGGYAFLLDPEGTSRERVNPGMVELHQGLDDEDLAEVRWLLLSHLAATGSDRAAEVLANLETLRDVFVKVVPVEYARAMAKERARPVVASSHAPALERPLDLSTQGRRELLAKSKLTTFPV